VRTEQGQIIGETAIADEGHGKWKRFGTYLFRLVGEQHFGSVIEEGLRVQDGRLGVFHEFEHVKPQHEYLLTVAPLVNGWRHQVTDKRPEELFYFRRRHGRVAVEKSVPVAFSSGE
jgi:NADH:ubiquinone oxidoreductase subunit